MASEVAVGLCVKCGAPDTSHSPRQLPKAYRHLCMDCFIYRMSLSCGSHANEDAFLVAVRYPEYKGECEYDTELLDELRYLILSAHDQKKEKMVNYGTYADLTLEQLAALDPHKKSFAMSYLDYCISQQHPSNQMRRVILYTKLDRRIKRILSE